MGGSPALAGEYPANVATARAGGGCGGARGGWRPPVVTMLKMGVPGVLGQHAQLVAAVAQIRALGLEPESLPLPIYGPSHGGSFMELQIC